MQLTKEEERALAGEKGEAISTAYRILSAIGEAMNADRLISINWAHVSGVNYNTIGDAGLQFLEELSNNTKVAVKTTLNPMGYDKQRSEGISESFKASQLRIVTAYERLGVLPSYTCTPYEVFDIPDSGTQVSFAESNAAVFSNSMLGLRTNKESALSALASAITGKAPMSDLRMDEYREPSLSIMADFELQNELDYGLMGYFAGKNVKTSSVSFAKVKAPTLTEAKSLAAGMGTSGACGMFSMNKKVKDSLVFDKKEKSKLIEELNTSESGDIIALGSPQLGMDELRLVASGATGKKFNKRCLIFCSRAIHNQAKKIGLASELERAGAEIRCDSCTCLTPYVTRDSVDSVITNGVKGAYYFGTSSKLGVCLKDLKTITKEHTS